MSLTTSLDQTEREADLRAGIILASLSIAWMVVEAAASIALGIAARSLLLTAFGADSLIELASAAVVLLRLRAESAGAAGGERAESLERRAGKLAGACLCLLAVYVLICSVWGLLAHRATDTRMSVWGILIGVVATVAMPILAKRKLRVAERLGSHSLRADAVESIACGYFSVILIVGLAATRLLGWWWLDSVAALAFVPFLIKEAREAMTGVCSCAGDTQDEAANGRRQGGIDAHPNE